MHRDDDADFNDATWSRICGNDNIPVSGPVVPISYHIWTKCKLKSKSVECANII